MKVGKKNRPFFRGAYWVKDMAPDYRATFESTGVSTEYFEDMFRETIGYAEKNDTVLYCGECGVIELARPEDTLTWYRTIRQVFDRHGIGRAAWSYRGMDFDLIHPRLDDVWKEM